MDKPPQEVIDIHSSMVEDLGGMFSVKGSPWRTICNRLEMRGILGDSDLGNITNMDELFITLMKKNKIDYGEYKQIGEILGARDVAATKKINFATKRIKEVLKKKGKPKQRHNSDSKSETEESNSKGRTGKRKISHDSDSEAEDEKHKPTLRRGYHKHSRDSDSGREADGGESNPKKENAGFLRKEHDDTHYARTVDTLKTAMDAVGFIQGPVASGTGFRVGKDKIMTAYHVVEAITKIHEGAKPDLSNLGQNNVFITFNFLEANDSKNTRKFYFTECLFHDKEMDFAILELRNKDKTEESSYPKAITHFNSVSLEQTFTLLGHPNRKPMQIDPKVHIFDSKSDQGKRRLEEMKQWGRKKGQKSAYENILDENKVLFDCWVQRGASGSPGFEIGSDGEPVCSFMLIHGYPDFVFAKGYEIKKEDHPYMIEQGVTMEAIAATLSRMGPKAKAIKLEIFADNAF